MKIKFFCPRWGSENIRWDNFLRDVKEAGYAGIEWFPFSENVSYPYVLNLLHELGLQFCIVMTVTETHDNFEHYLQLLESRLLELCSIRNDNIGPLFITAQTGREYFTPDQVEQCIECCTKVSDQTGVRINHETHRNKWAYAAHITLPFLLRHPDLRLTFDVSHWFCVSESYLEDQQMAVENAIAHTHHIHARIGHTQGPQVYEPSSPESSKALQEHLKIWDKWIAKQLEKGLPYCFITPEFGPPPYMVFANRNGTAQQEQWRLNLWMKNFLDKRYESLLL